MSMPLYLAVNDEEFIKNGKFHLAQTGFGFYPNGFVRLPKRIISGSVAIIDDLYLPNFSSSAAQMLKSKLPNGCILDFERKVSSIHKKLIQMLTGIKIIALPAAYHALSPSSYPIISCPEPCNSWRQFITDMQNKFPRGWMLEIVPWKQLIEGKAKNAEGMLASALCRYRTENGKLLYFDTKETIRQKLQLAQMQGCKGVIGLYRELKELK